MSFGTNVESLFEHWDQKPWEDELPAEPLQQVERLHAILSDRATGGEPDPNEFAELRKRLMSQPDLKTRLPSFLGAHRTLGQFWSFIKPKFSTYDERRKFLLEEFQQIMQYLEEEASTPIDDSIEALLKVVDRAHVRRAWSKAAERKANDPDGAVTMAYTLLETVCKHILEEDNKSYSGKAELRQLLHDTLDTLELLPEHQGCDWMKQMCQGSRSIVHAMVELRSLESDSHGVGVNHGLLDSFYAEYAVSSAGALAAFLIAVWEKQ